MNILDRINKPNDIKDIDREDLPELADEIREFLVSHVSETGGHLAPNLGCVELTMALHRVLDFPEDKLIWDVGHQSYVHKILTGRKNEMGTLRQFGGMSGFPKTSAMRSIQDTAQHPFLLRSEWRAPEVSRVQMRRLPQ